MRPNQISAVRKSLLDTGREIRALVNTFLPCQPMLKGLLYLCSRRCGKPTCRCTRGQRHTSTVLAYRGKGRQRNVLPQPEDLALIQKQTASYQEFRRARARLVKLSKERLRLIGLLERQGLAAGSQQFRKTQTGRRCDELAGD